MDDFDWKVANQKKESDGLFDPWKTDPLDPKGVTRSPDPLIRHRMRTDIPERRVLFQVQRDLVQAIDAFEQGTEKSVDAGIYQVGNAYRLLNRYLRQHGGEKQTPKGVV